MKTDANASLYGMLRTLKLPSFAANFEQIGIETEGTVRTFVYGPALRIGEGESHAEESR